MKQWYIIESKEEYAEATARYEAIRLAEEGSPDYREKKLLAYLISEYERQQWDLSELDPIDLIRIRMEEYGMQAVDLARVYGDKGTVSKVLNRKQQLSITMIRKFSKLLGIPADSLIKEYKIM